MYPILFQLGHFELRTYGVIVVLSFIAGLCLSTKESRRKAIDPELIQGFVVFALLGGILGARVYFIVFSDPAYFLQNPWEILAIWRGGISVIGSLIGGFLAGLWYCRRRGMPVFKFADTLAPGLPLGQAVGQLACLANGDSWGKPSDAPWAIVYTNPRAMAPLNVPLHPIELYEVKSAARRGMVIERRHVAEQRIAERQHGNFDRPTLSHACRIDERSRRLPA